jgi:selenocysteine-specific elongation factor
MDVWLVALPSAAGPLSHWQRVRLHIGTADVVARIALLRMEGGGKKAGILPGEGGPAQLLTETRIAAAAGQRFVIRFYSPLVTIGGGRIMLPNAETARGKADREAKARIVEELAADYGPVSLLAGIVRDKGVLNAAELSLLSQMDKTAFAGHLEALSREAERYGLLEFGHSRYFIAKETFDRVTRAALRLLHEFHAKYPELAGLDVERLQAALDRVHGAGRIKGADFKGLADIMAGRKTIAPVITRGKTCYRASDFNSSPDTRLMDISRRIRREAADAGFNLLKLQELEGRLGIPYPDIKRSAAYLREQGELWLIEGELLFSREIRDRLLKVLSLMNGDITVAALRDAAGVNRKLSLAMLDFLDIQGLTRRDGDRRTLAEMPDISMSITSDYFTP